MSCAACIDPIFNPGWHLDEETGLPFQVDHSARDAERQCEDRCGGRAGHSGHHQSSDYDEILREQRAALRKLADQVWGLTPYIMRAVNDDGEVEEVPAVERAEVLALIDRAGE